MAYIFSFQVYTYNGQNADKSFIQENLSTRFIYCLFVLPINNTRSDESILYSRFLFF